MRKVLLAADAALATAALIVSARPVLAAQAQYRAPVEAALSSTQALPLA